jgi:serine/threonine protein kinase
MDIPDPDMHFPASLEIGAGKSCSDCGFILSPNAPPELCPQCLLKAGMRGISAPVPNQDFSKFKRFGPYQLGKLLGKGGMGEAYEADDLETGRRIALKILSQRLDSPDARRRFLNEGRLAANINHPNSVYVFGVEEIAGVPVIAMELMPGGTLLDKICSESPISSTEAADITLQIIDGLAAAHAAGILHRDIKTSNCFVDTDGSVKIGDYGLSISTKGHERPTVSEESFMGTPMFAPPEQIRGDDLTVRSDIYSLGATLFTLLTGKPPFISKDTIRLLAKVLEQPAPDLREIRSDIPKGLADVVRRCLEKRPDDRFAGCDELRAAIIPFSSRGKAAAQLWRRLVAGIVDMTIIGIPFLIASQYISNNYQAPKELFIQSALLAISVVAWLAWFTIFEWKCGKTPGKSLLGLEVLLTKPENNKWSKGLRILGRSSLFVILPVVAATYFFSPIQVDHVETNPITLKINGREFTGSRTHTDYEWDLGLLTLATWATATLLLFAGSNRNNGWLSLHDKLTDTRVVSLLRQRPPRSKHNEIKNLSTEDSSMLGPFLILDTLSGCDDWYLGYDPKLLRKIWLRKLPPGSPPVAASLRNLRRPGRLRWLAGIRSPEENCDAYEFPGGKSLVSLTEQRVPWYELFQWMADLATELTAANSDGTQPSNPCIEQIWINADGRAKLLDFPAPGIKPPASFIRCSLWHDLTERLLKHSPLPLPVSAFLKKIPNISEPATITQELNQLTDLPHEVSRKKRLGIIAASATGPLLLGLGLYFLYNTMLSTTLFWSISALIAFVAIPAMISAAFAGDGLILRSFGLCVVDRNGNPATGSLAAKRSLIAWLPTLISPAIFAAWMIWTNPHYAAIGTLATLALLAFISAILPERTLHDCLANTFLVPR